PDPLVPYSLQKVVAEDYCRMFSRLWGLETISLRYFSVYGPRMNPNSPYALLLPKFIKLMSQDKIPVINGDGKQSRDFTFVSDIVEANLLAVKSRLSGEIFNIGYGKSISVNKVVRLLNKLMGKNIKPRHGPAIVEPRITLASNAKARKLLGWTPKVSFEEGLKKILL
ncbi:MAG: NAD-dependent epimerase/dehydratase, partial [Candidatus Woesebacteria bacterium GW2011_GWE1_45_18]